MVETSCVEFFGLKRLIHTIIVLLVKEVHYSCMRFKARVGQIEHRVANGSSQLWQYFIRTKDKDRDFHSKIPNLLKPVPKLNQFQIVKSEK